MLYPISVIKTFDYIAVKIVQYWYPNPLRHRLFLEHDIIFYF